ncbi:MAG TPA: DUF4382 domain-containing protein [Terriglobia bacterium]|jgi:hypothetical protein|nr:DUF4382 domain-containing protein [Terriglobia bacterium]
MPKKKLVMCLTVLLAAGTLASCGSSTTKPKPGNGAIQLYLTDTPAFCDLLGLRLTITDVKVVTTVGANKVSLYPTNAPPYTTVDFLPLRDSFTVLNLGTLVEETYGTVEVSLSVPGISIYDPTQTPPRRTVSPTLTSGTPSFALNPNLVVQKNSSGNIPLQALKLDFDVARSVQLGVDTSGNPTATVNPVFTATILSSTAGQDLATFDDLYGFVSSVSTTSTNPEFIGSFVLQTLTRNTIAGTGPALTINLTSKTQISGFPALNQLLTDSYTEVEGKIDSSGNFIADTVVVEDQEDPTQSKLAFLGVPLGITRDANGNPTQFDLYVGSTVPGDNTNVPDDAVVTVTVSPSTTFQASSPLTNFANLTFGPSNLALGQRIAVHGTYTKSPDKSISLPADKVFLRLQTLQGNFSSFISVGSDDKTGAFQLSPCCTILKTSPIYVLTNNQTVFVNLPGLSGLTPQPSLLVRGLPFLEQSATTINGIAIPAGTMVVLARQVHQIS